MKAALGIILTSSVVLSQQSMAEADVDVVTATASSVAEDRFGPGNVLDGDRSSGWKPRTRGEESITLDFKREISIEQFGIVWGWGEWGAEKYSIQISNDMKNWETITMCTEEMCIKDEMGHTRGFNRSSAFDYSPSKRARYLRLLLQKPRQKRRKKSDKTGVPYDSYLVNEILINDGTMVSTVPPPKDALYRNPEASPERRVKDLISRMTVTEKISLINGYECFYYAGLPRFGLRPISFSDATSGLHLRGSGKSLMGFLEKSTCFPAAALMAATFDRELIREVGKAIGEEFDGWPCEYREGVFVGYRWYDKYNKPVNFPFGHGLSYTTFEISDIKATSRRFVPGRPLTISVRVTNTGDVAGAEVAQLYVQDAEASVERPVRELKGYEKVFLKPGESKVVSMALNDRSFSFYDEGAHGWKVEAGGFIITVGNSSRNIQQRMVVTVR